MSLTDWTNVVLGVPAFGALLALVLLRKVVPGWALDDQKQAAAERVADLRASYEREIAVRDATVADLRAAQVELTRELRETGPTLVRANDGMRATQDLLREFLHRGGA
jgi:hypothetical protein